MSTDSKIVIDERVGPDYMTDKDAGRHFMACLSMANYVLFGSLGRKESQWRRLLDAAGLEVKELRRYTDLGDAIIIAVKK